MPSSGSFCLQTKGFTTKYILPTAAHKHFALVSPPLTWDKAAQLQSKHPDLHWRSGPKALLREHGATQHSDAALHQTQGLSTHPVIFGKACPHAVTDKHMGKCVGIIFIFKKTNLICIYTSHNCHCSAKLQVLSLGDIFHATTKLPSLKAVSPHLALSLAQSTFTFRKVPQNKLAVAHGKGQLQQQFLTGTVIIYGSARGRGAPCF